MDMENTVTFNQTTDRYEMPENGLVVYARTHRKDNVLYIDYVEAPEALRGTGAAGRFMTGLMGIVRDEQLKVIPICGYAASWLRRHSEEYGDLLAEI